MIHHGSAEACKEYLDNAGFQIYSTALSDDSVSLYSLDLSSGKVALAFGNEQRGVSSELVEASKSNFLIPMFGMIESLNVSVAASISIYEAVRQRIVAGNYNTVSLSPEQYQQAFTDYSWK